ncbi:hypothetical protein FJR39_22660 [Dolichospermum flos-aquae UHCC 0037]|uniref:Uncharacterized protein n=1 Tax=Dolichospermum flos-aquae UHCC 0037 TaxID=2590026 RepID=A0ACC7SC56_DOLFA|nr:hypothetical protein [Dolichospermum flos-aquae UHCC 0037]
MNKYLLKISDPDISTLIFYSHLLELEHLYNSFKFLISGKCFYLTKTLCQFGTFIYKHFLLLNISYSTR